RMPMLGGSRIDCRVVVCSRYFAIKAYLSFISAFMGILPVDCKNYMSTLYVSPVQIPRIASFLNVSGLLNPTIILCYGHGRRGTVVVQYGHGSSNLAGTLFSVADFDALSGRRTSEKHQPEGAD